MRIIRRVAIGSVLSLMSSGVAYGQSTSQDNTTDLASLSIEDLSKVTVTSVSKQPEPLNEAAASIYVVRRDEIERSTANSLPELLASVPNLQSQRINSYEYAFSSRGFNGYDSSNKLLAQIDGRAIYTPLFSGIFWEQHSPLLEDLDQIEVVSGPGGTLYGPNAVNGVISITTKDARDTLGGIVRATGATNQQTAAVRYGVPLGDAGAVRAYVNYYNHADMPGLSVDFPDQYHGFQTGFRADTALGASTLTVQGDLFRNRGWLLNAKDRETGHNLLTRLVTPVGPGTLEFQGYYDSFEQKNDLLIDSLNTFDFDGQYSIASGRHALVVGMGVRSTDDFYDNNAEPFELVPESRRLWTFNAYVQDKYAVNNRLSVVLGFKLEQSTLSGLQFLPNIRLAYQPNDSNLFWAAVSRAVRTPSRVDKELIAPGFLISSPGFRSETLVSFETGYRGQLSTKTSVSISAFYNIYDNIRTLEQATPAIFPWELRNSLNVRTYGIEAWATQQVTPWWRLRLGGTYLHKNANIDEGHIDLQNSSYAGNDPSYTFKAWSEMNLSDNLRLDLGLRAVGALERANVGSYVEGQARLGFFVSKNVEMFVSGTNLLHNSHIESGEPRAQLIERSVSIGSRLRF